MAFNYETLKKYKSESFVDLTIQSDRIENLNVTEAKLDNNAVSADKMATNTLNLNSNKTTGVLPTSKGGSGTSNLGSTAYGVITSNGSSWTSSHHGIYSMSVYTSSGTWNRPSGVRWIRVQVQFGGY